MPASATYTPSGYWYDDDQVGATDVLNLFRRYRAADERMQRRTRESMEMGDNDLRAMRFLSQSRATGRAPVARELAELLRISTASVTALIDRLVRAGHVVREANPADRRSIVLRTTESGDERVRGTLDRMHGAMMTAAERLDPAERQVVARFLREMTDAVETGAPAATATDRPAATGMPTPRERVQQA
ncbi:MAG: MarR family transcriptional regulator [Microbacteriaceae bacterium]